MAHKISIIDLGVGNMLSLSRAFERCGAEVSLVSNASDVFGAQKLVLPGVGAFASGMRAIKSLNLIDVLKEVALKEEIPILGICLGMQLLMEKSAEFGLHEGLGIIPGSVVPIKSKSITGDRLRVPNIGWSPIKVLENQEANQLLKGIDQEESFYFVHSYTAIPKDSQNRVADCVYGGHQLSAIINKNIVFGCQFHPEKSGEVGLKMLENYIFL